jgi:penicillin-binding protein 1C
LVICWTGNANYEGRPDVIGVETSAPLLFQMMDYLPKSAFFEAPLDWQYPKVVCRESGFLAQENCRWRDTLDLGKAPLKNCAFCSSVYLNSAGLRSHRNCSDEELIDSSWMILSPAMAWYAQRSSLNYKAPPEWDPNCASGEEENLEFIYPSGFEVIRRSRDLEGSLGKVILEAGHRNGEAKIFWYVDEQYVGTTEVSHKLEIALSPGLHQILIMDKKGNSTQARLKVVE